MSDHDVTMVGGGPAGCSAGVFTARYGLDTVVFDGGSAALPRCAYPENRLGSPADIAVGDSTGPMHVHVHEAGCAGHGAEVGVTIIEDGDRPVYHDRVAPDGYFTGRGRDLPPRCGEIDEGERREREDASLAVMRDRFIDPHSGEQITRPRLVRSCVPIRRRSPGPGSVIARTTHDRIREE